MTYSICVRERGSEGWRFGVAAAARIPAVGAVCPAASERGAVAVAGVTPRDASDRCLSLLDAGRPVDEAVDALIEEGAADRQVHAVGVDGAGAHTGADCPTVADHRVGEAHTVAGTATADASVLDAVARGYESNERDAPLPRRLVTALAAGERAGGDDRDLPVGSAAVVVRTGERPPLHYDLRVDASESPVADLRETYRRAKRGYEAALERYAQTEN